MSKKSILDQKSLRWLGIDWENDELIVLVLTILLVGRVMGYV